MDMDSRFPEMKWKIKKYPDGSEEWHLVRPGPNKEDQIVGGFYCGPGASKALAKLTEDDIESTARPRANRRRK